MAWSLGRMAGGPDAALRARLRGLSDEGREIWRRFDDEVRRHEWHPFVHGDYEHILQALAAARARTASRAPGAPRTRMASRTTGVWRTPRPRFLEWGSASGVVSVMADLLGYDACGIELDPKLVEVARGLARRHGSSARFACGSFLPAGYRWQPLAGDGRLGTVGEGPPAYPELGHPLHDFDVVYAYPWNGEEGMMVDLMRRYGNPEAELLLYQGGSEVHVFRDGRPDPG